MLILMTTSPLACIQSSLTALTESLFVSIRIAGLGTDVYKKDSLIKMLIATKSAPQFIIIYRVIGIRLLSLRLWLRSRVIFGRLFDFGFLDLTCSSFFAFNHV
ncbi:unnamed protein product [Hymenolepis diminuta]|uniref:Uncharacterized protein n=1 Tax=Hymenolepis diminuta TaxID=6216 RepID=A0A564XYB3_HYMDI|nr:unnamed protein product [Hymenolepis diminuta]